MENLFNVFSKVAENNGVKSKENQKNDLYTEQAIKDWAEKKGKLELLNTLVGKERKRLISNIRKEIRDFIINGFVLPLANAKDKEQFNKRYKDFSSLFGQIYIEKTPTFSVFSRINSDDYLPTIEKAKKQFEKYNSK